MILVNSHILDAKEKQSFSLSINAKGQLMKIGTSKDYMAYAKASVRAMVGNVRWLLTQGMENFGTTRPGNLENQQRDEWIWQVVLWFAATLIVRATTITMATGEAKGFERQSHGGAITANKLLAPLHFGIKRTNLSTGTYSHQNRSLQGGHGNFTVGQRGMVLSSAQDALKRKRHGERFASQLQKKIEQKGLDRLGVGQRNIAKFYSRVMVPALNPRVTEKRFVRTLWLNV